MTDADILMHFETLPEKKREELRDDIEGYKLACRLARGANPERSKHWRQEAAIRGNRLAQRMGIHPK